ncbi:MAG: hypothetical protein KF723_02745 [Rhizobiaceae bacterium]|nr:hypothetical protein [Rhizobiaceae bacterium]
MSQRRDWSDPEAWADMLSYEPADFAVEYLVRNEEFVAECRALLERVKARHGELIGTTKFVARWGARFHHRR